MEPDFVRLTVEIEAERISARFWILKVLHLRDHCVLAGEDRKLDNSGTEGPHRDVCDLSLWLVSSHLLVLFNDDSLTHTHHEETDLATMLPIGRPAPLVQARIELGDDGSHGDRIRVTFSLLGEDELSVLHERLS